MPQTNPSRLRPRTGHHNALVDAAKSRIEKIDDSQETSQKTNPLHAEKLIQAELQARMEFGRRRRDGSGLPTVGLALLGWRLARVNRTRPVRAVNLFFFRYGTVMAAGAAYMMFFSVAALLWAGFSVAGIVVGNSPEYQQLIIQSVNNALPGLLSDGGLMTEEQVEALFHVGGFNLSLSIAVILAIFTSLSWLHGLRSGMRSIWERPLMAENIVAVKVKDLGVLTLLGVVALTSAILGFISHTFIEEIFELFDWDPQGGLAQLTRLASLVISFGLDMVVAVLLMRLASHLVIPVSALWQSALIAGIGASLLRLLSAQLLSNFSDSPNPLLSGFGAVLGAFFYFYLFGLVYLVAAAWGAVAASDHAHHKGPTRQG